MAGRLCEALECEQVPGPLDRLVDAMDWPAKVVLQDRDYQYLKAYPVVMGPMMEKSDQLGAETVSTIHLVYPTLMELEAHLKELARKPLCKAFAADLWKNIKFYFCQITDSATYLSPVHHHIMIKIILLRIISKLFLRPMRRQLQQFLPRMMKVEK